MNGIAREGAVGKENVFKRTLMHAPIANPVGWAVNACVPHLAQAEGPEQWRRHLKLVTPQCLPQTHRCGPHPKALPERPILLNEKFKAAAMLLVLACTLFYWVRVAADV